MDPLIALLAAAVGYLLGSISFARVVTRLFAPSVDIGQGIEIDIAGTEEKLQVRAIAGTCCWITRRTSRPEARPPSAAPSASRGSRGPAATPKPPKA